MPSYVRAGIRKCARIRALSPYAASYLASSAHLPEISVPAGRDSQNMPIGLSFAGAQDSERILLGLAAAYEKISPYKNGDGLELD